MEASTAVADTSVTSNIRCEICGKERDIWGRGADLSKCLGAYVIGVSEDHIRLGNTMVSAMLDRIQMLEQKVDQLQAHHDYAPGGPGMLAAKADFETRRSPGRGGP